MVLANITATIAPTPKIGKIRDKMRLATQSPSLSLQPNGLLGK
jgi:hypothetical protein